MAGIDSIICDEFFENPKMGLDAMLRAEDSLLKEAKDNISFKNEAMKRLIRSLTLANLPEDSRRLIEQAKTEDEKIVAAALIASSLSKVIENINHYAIMAKENGAPMSKVGSLAVLMGLVKSIYTLENPSIEDKDVARIVVQYWVKEDGTPRTTTNFADSLADRTEGNIVRGAGILLSALEGNVKGLAPPNDGDIEYLLTTIIEGYHPPQIMDKLYFIKESQRLDNAA